MQPHCTQVLPTNFVEEVSASSVLEDHVETRNIGSSRPTACAEFIRAHELQYVDVFQNVVDLNLLLERLSVSGMPGSRLARDGSVGHDFDRRFLSIRGIGIDCLKDTGGTISLGSSPRQ